MFNRTTQVSIRTNNEAEAYHRRIGSVMQCAHPTLWIFLQKLIDEENAIHVNILQIKASQPQRKNKNQRFEERLLHVISICLSVSLQSICLFEKICDTQ